MMSEEELQRRFDNEKFFKNDMFRWLRKNHSELEHLTDQAAQETYDRWLETPRRRQACLKLYGPALEKAKRWDDMFGYFTLAAGLLALVGMAYYFRAKESPDKRCIPAQQGKP